MSGMSKKQEHDQDGSKPRKYSDQFKAEAVAMVTELGKRQADVARELGIPTTTLARWLGGSGAPGHAAADASLSARDQEMARLKSQIRRLEQENSFLNYRDFRIIQGIQTFGLSRPAGASPAHVPARSA
jgi:transposase